MQLATLDSARVSEACHVAFCCVPNWKLCVPIDSEGNVIRKESNPVLAAFNHRVLPRYAFNKNNCEKLAKVLASNWIGFVAKWRKNGICVETLTLTSNE